MMYPNKIQILKNALSPKKWENYKRFFQLNILKYLVFWFTLVPIVAVLFEDVPEQIAINIGEAELVLNIELPFYWELMWLSSFFFVVALFLYKVFCPDFIHKYNKYGDYEVYGHDPRWLVWESHFLLMYINDKQRSKFLDRLTTKEYATTVKAEDIPNKDLEGPIVEKSQTVLFIEHGSEYVRLGLPIDSVGFEKGIFYEIFGRYSESHRVIRWCIQVFLIISVLLFVVVLGQHIYEGLQFIFNSVSGLWPCHEQV